MNSFPLQPGTLVDPSGKAVYVMEVVTSRQGSARIDLTTGRETWHSKQAAKPWGPRDPRASALVDQVHPAAPACPDGSK